MATKKKPLRKRISLGALFGSLQEELEQTMKPRGNTSRIPA